MDRQLKYIKNRLASQSMSEQHPERKQWDAKSQPFKNKTFGVATTLNKVCVYCGQSIPTEAVICPHCGHSLTPEKCSFCGAPMKSASKFCTQCGQPREGILCPECGTLNARNFCRKCNAPLTEIARLEQAAAQNDPAFKAVQAKAAELAKLHAQIEELKNSNKYYEEDVPYLSNADQALIDEYAAILQLISTSSAQQNVTDTKQEKHTQYADTEISLDAIMTVYREKAAEMDAALAAMVPPPDYTPEQQRDYYSARKVATMHTEYDLSDYQPSVWKCNVCGALHNCPSECVAPQFGGTWIYITPEQYIEENGEYIVSQRTLKIE